MGLIKDITNFLETRLEEYIRKNPQMELQMLLEQLKQQETEILKIIADFELKEKKFQDQILAIAEDIKLWHNRAIKANESGRQDLANAANERETALLKQGNQVWAQMSLAKQRLAQTFELSTQIQARITEIKQKISEAAKSQSYSGANSAENSAANSLPNFGWGNLNPPPSADDPLEAKFHQWEMDEEIARLKRKIK